MVPILLCKLHLEALVSSINVLITQPFSTAWTLMLVNTVHVIRPGNQYNSRVCLETCNLTSNNSILTSVCKVLVSLPLSPFSVVLVTVFYLQSLM